MICSFWVILLTDKQTHTGENILTSLAEVIEQIAKIGRTPRSTSILRIVLAPVRLSISCTVEFLVEYFYRERIELLIVVSIRHNV